MRLDKREHKRQVNLSDSIRVPHEIHVAISIDFLDQSCVCKG